MTFAAASASASSASAPSNDAPDLSVVIVSWNTRALLADCLRTVFDCLAGTPELRADVWVVDNDSRDGSEAMVRESFPDVHCIQSGANIGFACGNNLALRQATGRYLLLLNSDTLVPAGALAALVAAMDAHPDAAVCSPLLLNADGSPQICWSRFQGPRSELLGELDRSQSPYPLADFADPARRAIMEPFVVDWVGGACFLARGSAAREVGLLDEGFFMYSEETEWCHRLRRASTGGKTLLVPAVTVTHLGGQSSRAVPTATRERMYRSAVRLYRILYGASPTAGAAILLAWGRFVLFRFKHKRRTANPPGISPGT